MRVEPRTEAEFLRRYRQLCERIELGLEGHLVHRLSQDLDDSDRWVIESHWESLEAEEAWERSPEHRELTTALRECWSEVERTRYAVRVETLHP